MTDIIERLKEPEAHYPGNFDTPKRANAMLSCLCQEAMEEIESLRRELTEARQEIADRKADCEAGHDQDEATIAELRQQLKHMTDHYNASIEAEQVRYRQVVEKDAEIERLSDEIGYQSQWKTEFRQQKEYAEKQLAAIQSREQELRDQVKVVCGPVMDAFTDGQRWNDYQEIIDQPQDTAALSATIAKAGEVMRERCAVECETHYNFSNALAAAIRALPAVTLDDLKGGA